MNSHHKLYDFEVTPPAEAWDRIAAELEGINTYHEISKKLANAEMDPPPGIWDKISQELHEDKSFDIVANKLRALEMDPPAGAWNEIEKAINPTDRATRPAPVYSIRRRNIKYAVAAAVIGLVGILFYYLSISTSKDADVIIANWEKENIQELQSTPPARIPETKSQSATQKSPSGENIAKTGGISGLENLKTGHRNVYAPSFEKNRETQGRYIVLMTEGGDVVRMSRKFGTMADCIAGENPGADCSNQIAKWQEELASAPVSSTPDNLLDILDLANREQGL